MEVVKSIVEVCGGLFIFGFAALVPVAIWVSSYLNRCQNPSCLENGHTWAC